MDNGQAVVRGEVMGSGRGPSFLFSERWYDAYMRAAGDRAGKMDSYLRTVRAYYSAVSVDEFGSDSGRRGSIGGSDGIVLGVSGAGLEECEDDGGVSRDRAGGVAVAVESGVHGGASDVEAGVEVKSGGSFERGANYQRNLRWRNAKKASRGRKPGVTGVASDDWRASGSGGRGSCGPSDVGRCWTVKEESEMEKRIREALEKKKAVEAELAARKAELALGRMNDVVLTELYDNRVKQEGICKMNQAIVKSEKSLENLKSVSPGSSATPGEIREALLNSEKWKYKEKKIRAWAASGHADSGIVEILDGEDDEDSLDDYMRALAVEGQDEADRQVETNRMWKNAYKTDDEIAAQENKVKAQYDARVLGKVAGKRVSGKAARDEEEKVRKAQFAHDLAVAKLKDLEAQMLRSC